jgi:biotin-dependent carboxylase-like uncharacterized protein
MTGFTIVRAGWASTVQDGGRPGLAHLGVPRAGAVDPEELAVLNRLVGNRPDAAGIETAGGLVLRAAGAALVATSGERAARSVRAGELVEVDPAPQDLYAYLAVRGGIEVRPVLGSRSHDTLSGLGPPALVPGDHLPVGADPATTVVGAPAPRRPRPDVVTVWAGPRTEWFEADALDHLTAVVWIVSGGVSRVGVRLEGPALARRVGAELPSEGLVPGAIQVPPDGRPVVMSANHPTTGGYPVIAVVDPGHLTAVVQAPPGSTVRFRVVGR